MRSINQIFAITALNLRNIPNRLGSSLVIVIGIAGVVGVLVALLSMAQGFAETLRSTGRLDRAIIVSAGVTSELSSALSRDNITVLKQLPGIAHAADGGALASAELVVITELKRGGNNKGDVNVALRGVEPAGFAIRPEVKILEGRMFQAGLREVIAGKSARAQFSGVDVGSKLQFRGSEWTVVGIFESAGDAHESELWADADTARSAFGRSGSSSMLVQLEMESALATLEQGAKSDPRLQVDVQAEQKYFSAQSKNFTEQIGFLTGIVAAIMAVGALFAALNTMYSAVSTRQVEIATLRAIGFSGGPVVISVLVESIALAVLGGLLGALLAYLLFNGMTVSTLGQNFTQVAFNFRVGPQLLIRGLVWALIIGFIGGFFPAIRAARQPVTTALRAL